MEHRGRADVRHFGGRRPRGCGAGRPQRRLGSRGQAAPP